MSAQNAYGQIYEKVKKVYKKVKDQLMYGQMLIKEAKEIFDEEYNKKKLNPAPCINPRLGKKKKSKSKSNIKKSSSKSRSRSPSQHSKELDVMDRLKKEVVEKIGKISQKE